MPSLLLRGAGALSLLAAPALAQVDYALSFEPGGTLWKVEATLPGRGEDALDFWIPLWTPGAYHLAEFGRFVKELTALDEQGRSLVVERPEDSHFVVRGAAGAKRIVLRYTAESISSGLFSHDIIDVESNRIAQDYAYVTPVSLFGFVPARAKEEVRLTLTLPPGWRAATVLGQDSQGRYVAPSYLRFEDSPFLFSPTLESAEFSVDEKPHTVTAHGRGAREVAEIAAGCKRIAEAASSLLGGLPYDRYHFLLGFVPEAQGSGLEHSYSTLILASADMPISGEGPFWGIAAHEYMHLWTAERIHVEGIHHPDLTQSFSTGTIWVNEGVTEYFTRHLLFHAGFYDERKLLASYVTGPAPSSDPSGSSWTDVSRAAEEWNGMTDLMAFALRMYFLGPRTLFALDLTMRRATGGERGVLDFIRYLMREYVARDRGFREDELDEILAQVGGQEAVAFYERYIDGKEIPDPTPLLEVIGYGLEKGSPVPLDGASAAQLRARRDYLSITGEP